MGITIPVYLHFVSFIRSFFQNFFQSKDHEEPEDVRLFGDRNPRHFVRRRSGIETDGRREKDAEASPEEGTSLERLKRQESGCLDQPDWECLPGPPLRALTEEGTSLKRLKRLSSDQGTEEDKKLNESREAGFLDFFRKLKRKLKKALK